MQKIVAGCATSRAFREVASLNPRHDPIPLYLNPADGASPGLPRFTQRRGFHPPNFFHHIFLVPSSQTRTTIGANIARPCAIEKFARLQRRTHFPPFFHRSLTTYGSDEHPSKCTPNRRIYR
jgi:hypothetical protein